MKKKIFALAVLLIYVSLIAYGTYAFRTVEEVAHNVITTNGVDIEIEEWQLVGGEREKYPDGTIIIMPGMEVSKIVTVHNFDADAYLRCRYELTVFDVDGEVMEIDPAVLSEIVVIEPNTTDWTLLDGWYYYNTSLTADEVTEPLFSEVTFPAEKLTNEFQGAKLIVTVYASGVQSANNGGSVFEAAGWAE